MWCGPEHLTEKKVVCVGTEPPNFKDLNHVKELTMYVPDDGYWSGYVHDIALFH